MGLVVRDDMKQIMNAILILAIVLALSGCTQKTGENPEGQITQAVIKNNAQEVDMKINASGYFPNTIIAKKDIPLRINVHSENDAGCAADVVFPDFGVEKIIPAGSSGTIEISPSTAGTFNFRCTMGMFRGKLIIRE